jgi:hypothetical protein
MPWLSPSKDLKVAGKIVRPRNKSTSRFEKALEDDAKNPEKVTFGEGQEGTRFDVLKAVYEVRPPNMIFDETVANGGTAFTASPTAPLKRTRLAGARYPP